MKAVDTRLETVDASSQRDLALCLAAGVLVVLALAVQWWAPGQADLANGIGGIAAALVGVPILWRAWQALQHPDLEGITDQLVALALLAAWAAGDLITAAVVPLAMLVGHLLEERSLAGTREAIDALKHSGASEARRFAADGSIETVAADQLTAGDRIELRPGDRIPADGTIEEGRSELDIAAMTGESLPVVVNPGDQALAGGINLAGVVVVRVERAGNQTAMGRVLDLLNEAEQSKPPVTRVLERHASRYLPVVLLGSLAVLFVTGELSAMLAVLVASCPCALALAAPSTAVAAVATASRLGLLVKGTAFLERLADVETVVFDKTGTLSYGRLAVLSVQPADGISREEVLATASALASKSHHPVSRAIAGAAVGDEQWDDIEERRGLGMVAQRGTRSAALGRRDLLLELGIDAPNLPDGCASVVGCARDGKFIGWILLADEVREEAADTIASLRRLGIQRQVVISGDRQAVVEQVAGSLGIDQSYAEVLPADKLHLVQAEQADGQRVLVVGDGMNDALALRAGSVSMAMGGSGTDLAMASSDLVLVRDQIERIPTAIRFARQCRRTVAVNVIIALSWTGLMVVGAAAGMIGPLLASILHNVGTIAVIINAARLLRFTDQGERHGDEELATLLDRYRPAAQPGIQPA